MPALVSTTWGWAVGGWLLALASVVAAVACVEGEPLESLESTSNSCLTDVDCEQGKCVASVCSAPKTSFGALLLEVIPPPANTRFLGARYYKVIEVEDPPSKVEFAISPPLTVSGEISLSLGDATCRPSPVEVTFVPVETYLGVDTVRYSAISRVGTTIIDRKHVDTHTYQLPGVPTGTYDVFLRDAELVDNTATPACEVVPDVQRGIKFSAGPGTTRLVFNIAERPARSLRVVVPSRAWQGWRVDVVHSKSKELQSSRGTLAVSDDPTQDEAYTDVRLSTSEPDTNQLLLRLRPPAGQIAPTVSMVLAGLEVFELGQALVPKMESFAHLVTYQTWVWRSMSGGGFVPGKVHFKALDLASVPLGVTASFEVWSEIGEQGLVTEDLPPGKYSVEVSPKPGSAYSSAKSEITVWAPTPELPGMIQGGHVLQVNQAVNLNGTLDALGQRPPLGTQVRLVGVEAWPATGGAGLERPVKGSPLPVDVSDLVSTRAFQLDGVDCGNCAVEALPVLYNLEVLPPEQSGFPRVLMPGLAVNAQIPLSELAIELPVVVNGSVVVNGGSAAVPEARGFPGVLVRAYALLSSTGSPFSNSVPSCWETQGSPTCAASVIEVASTYTGTDGAFRLLLPQGFTPYIAPLVPDAGLR